MTRDSGLPIAKGSALRDFGTGATRDTADGKHSFERSFSPRVMRRFALYMYEHNALPNGERRREDNWQKGIPQEVCIDSAFRHFMDWWTLHRGIETKDFAGKTVDIEEALCGLMFNLQAYMHNLLVEKEKQEHGTK